MEKQLQDTLAALAALGSKLDSQIAAAQAIIASAKN
jgi:hypothetical protein